MNTTSVEVTAGLGGFLVVFALALAVWFLGRDLTRRLRRMNRAEESRLAQERAGQQPVLPGPATGETPAAAAPADQDADGDRERDPLA